MAEITNVELVSVGAQSAGGEASLTAADLDAMARAFHEAGFRVPLKRAEDADAGSPALGWLRSLRRVGAALVADLTDLPEAVAAAVRRGARVSLETFRGLRNAAGTWPWAVKAISVAGLPARIGALPELAWHNMRTFQALGLETFAVTLPQEGRQMIQQGVMTAFNAWAKTEDELHQARLALRSNAGALLDALTRQRMVKTKEDYITALHAVQAEQRDLMGDYV